jgi:hypothetical protein
MEQKRRAPQAAGLPVDDLTGGEAPGNNANATARQQRLFALRCRQMAERVYAHAVPIMWAADVLYEAAICSGLTDDVGDDRVQEIMADAFAGARRP